VRVTGEVKDSTKVIFPLAQGMTVGQLLNMVGGITEYADRNGIVLVRGDERIKVNYDEIVRRTPGRDIPLRDKDELNVPRLERPRQFKVAGAVRNANTFPLTSRTNLLDAIGLAGGPMDGAQQNNVEIRRTNALGVVTTYKYDLKDNKAAATEILDGDYVYVPYPKQRQKMDIPTIIGILSGIVFIWSSVR
jgi:protein involved in polysaccharide export with SLBB domain